MIPRRCPSDKIHWGSKCDCISNNPLYYHSGRWNLTEKEQFDTPHSSLSFSGQMSGVDLWLAGVKSGILLFLILALIVLIVIWYEINKR